jgi:diaminopimelate epimerase
MGLYLCMRGEAPEGLIRLGGPAGEVQVECLPDGMMQVDMGRPEFDAAAIPIDMEPVDGWYGLDTAQGRLRIGAASMGNPHALLVVDDIGQTDVAGLGSEISTHPAFPRGCNAGFAQLLGRDHVRLRVYERGSGETRACGSGACAAVAMLHRAGMVENTVQVTQKGGNLVISWPGGKKKVIMKGDATHVFEGKLS